MAAPSLLNTTCWARAASTSSLRAPTWWRECWPHPVRYEGWRRSLRSYNWPTPIPAYLFELGLRWFQETPDTERFFAVRWDGDAYRVVVPEQAGTTASLTYEPPAGVVAEFHSHGNGRAFFSGTDDRDEQGFRIYGVVWRTGDPKPELSLRVGVYGHFAPVQWPQVFDGPDPGVQLMDEEPVSTHTKD